MEIGLWMYGWCWFDLLLGTTHIQMYQHTNTQTQLQVDCISTLENAYKYMSKHTTMYAYAYMCNVSICDFYVFICIFTIHIYRRLYISVWL